MNAAQKRAMQYGNLINNTVNTIQEEQDKLNPEFEKIRGALDRSKVDQLDSVEYTKIQKNFADGTKKYQETLAKLEKGKAPARLMGTHITLVSAFRKYVEACADMTESIGDDKNIDRHKFDESEKGQDEAMDKFSKLIQKLTNLA
ncbi:hypothetical protein [Companilactobacillus kimchii]|uniref:Uncharacterized protein n=2 Tax=Companilactobacillus kimchii TaxID=2801452 RepID=A0ABR5NRJ6_9LACO|nr:hypothetical protein [Companilactobacillus kimchii]GEO47580.1 hypothetical protein LKI01_15790 [Companilactobacillus paralimentarius]KAE9559280.1 hypothetical protein ATN91_11580 [Companilactobacillus kimchii]KAE9560803.1 hypothetical protein ATN91_08325 [Companilactobacillus kimchii]KRK50665.1 hypothetical protein FC97_GL001304 [Companilactobacillus kimchii DSM 13961 = JCM 10707]OWF32423.1 hypothetical protein LKACC12383_01942 [Companilactobacillus kimchii]